MAVLAHQAKAAMVAQILAPTMDQAAAAVQVKQAKIGKALGRATAVTALLLHQSDGIALLL